MQEFSYYLPTDDSEANLHIAEKPDDSNYQFLEKFHDDKAGDMLTKFRKLVARLVG